MTAQLSFHQTHLIRYPQPAAGGATAMTIATNSFGDPFLAFITQEPQGDHLYFLDTCEGTDHFKVPITTARQEIGGMGWSPIDGLLYCGNGFDTREYVTALSAEDGSVVRDFELDRAGSRSAAAFATNGWFLLRGEGEVIELRTMNGMRLAQRRYPGRNIRGASASPQSWILLDAASNEIVVIDPFGREIAVAPAPGSPGIGPAPSPVVGGHAIAFDYIRYPDPSAQLCTPLAGPPPDIGFEPGSPYRIDTPWDPTPWQAPHRIYIASQTNNRIYGGYLTAA